MKRALLISFLFLVCFTIHAQNRSSKWTVGLSGALVNFGDGGVNSVGDNFLYQFPKISVTRYVAHGLSVDLSSSISTIDELDGFFKNQFNYFSIDGTIRYDFGTSKENLVPYVGLGMGWIGAPSTLTNAKSTPTTNFVFGGTFWFSPKFGFNAEFVYKNSSEQYESMRSHSQMSAGLVYSFRPRQMVRRLWHHRR